MKPIVVTFESETHFMNGTPCMEVKVVEGHRAALKLIREKRLAGHCAGVFFGTVLPPIKPSTT